MDIVLLSFSPEPQATQQRVSVRSERTHPFPGCFLELPSRPCRPLLPPPPLCPAPVPSFRAQSSPLSSLRGAAGTRGRHRLRAAVRNTAPFLPSPPPPTSAVSSGGPQGHPPLPSTAESPGCVPWKEGNCSVRSDFGASLTSFRAPRASVLLRAAQKEWPDIKTCCNNVPRNNAALIAVFQERERHFLPFILPASSMQASSLRAVPVLLSWHCWCVCRAHG